MNKVKGPYTAIVTPFTESGVLHTESLRNQVERQVGQGNNIFCNGTNGEFFILQQQEKLAVVKTCVDAVKNSASVITHIGEMTTRQTIEHGKQVQDLGVDAVSVITPWFSALRDPELIDHYINVADSLSIPVYLYNIPARTGNAISPAVATELAQHPNIFGIKDSAGSFDSLSGFLNVSNKCQQFDVLTGPDSLILKGYQEGAIGCVSGIANIVPDKVNAVYRHFINDEVAKAELVQNEINQLRTSLYSIAFAPAVVKKSLALMGHDVGDNRYPVNFYTSDVNKIKQVLSEQLGTTFQ